jgi:putative sigma-54 modulation protein
MELTINGRNLEITQRIENYVQKKTGKLDRYMPDLVKIHVDLSEENTRSALQRQVAQITVRDDRGTILRAEERSNDLFVAIDAVIDKLYRQINRYQGKRRRKGRGAAEETMLMGEPLPVEEALDEEEEDQTIVRYKRFPVHPMPAEEAIEQMELLGHDFFVFYNPDDEAINVLYKRHDGNYGLLQPELG